MKQCRCNLKKITCAPIIFVRMRIKRRTETISPVWFRRTESILAKITSVLQEKTLLEPCGDDRPVPEM
jgi:hypothetical protein